MSRRAIILPGSFRSLGIGYFVISLAVLSFSLYFIWARVTIIIHPVAEGTNLEFSADLIEAASVVARQDQDVVTGRILTLTVEDSQTFASTGSRVLESEIVGEVTIVNNYSQAQTLIETTRLARPEAPDTVVARLARTVDVAPGETVRVPVVPDNPADFAEVEPTRLIIPGLWGALQEFIYAENEQTLGSGPKQIAVVQAEDIDAAQEKLRQGLRDAALEQLNQQLSPTEKLWPKLLSLSDSPVSFSVAAGDEASEFTGRVSLEVVAAIFDETQMLSLARRKLTQNLPPDKQLANLDPQTFSYDLVSYDLAAKTAQIAVSVEGRAVINQGQGLIDPAELTALTAQQVSDKLTPLPQVESVEVKFTPTWLRKTPRIAEKIQIEISP